MMRTGQRRREVAVDVHRPRGGTWSRLGDGVRMNGRHDSIARGVKNPRMTCGARGFGRSCSTSISERNCRAGSKRYVGRIDGRVGGRGSFLMTADEKIVCRIIQTTSS
jgi:hypothetical protein